MARCTIFDSSFTANPPVFHNERLHAAQPATRRPLAEIASVVHAFGADLGIDAPERQIRPRRALEQPSKRPDAELRNTMKVFGVDVDIDAPERVRRTRSTSEPPVKRTDAELTATMQVFGVDLDIDAAERQRRSRRFLQAPSKRPDAEVRRTMQIFGVEVDIDAPERVRRPRQTSEPPERRSDAEVAGTMQVFGVDLDIDAAERQRRRAGKAQKATGILPQASATWDAPMSISARSPRLKWFDQWSLSSEWAEQFGRPRRGNTTAVWQEETQATTTKAIVDNDVQGDIEALSRELKRGLPKTAVKRRGAPSKPHKICESPPDGSHASTASGDAQVFDIEPASSPEAFDFGMHSPEVNISTPGTASPDVADSESDEGVFHLINDPKGKHALLSAPDTEVLPASCQPIRFPLGFRRVMSACLPADPDTSLQLSLAQMRKLHNLHSVIQRQQGPASARAHKKACKQRYPLR